MSSESLLKLTADYDQQLGHAVTQIEALGLGKAADIYRQILDAAVKTNDPKTADEAFANIVVRFAVVGFLAASIALDVKGESA